ncbi:helix-turn-helix transcriptional regulator [Serratia rubidaea]|uniref:helix-turn-helix transcriptional regulator n=1 Tax=Serratia rubidaea TaxID=61652 RepID=UPI0022B87EDC|nr:LuxR C-terminal-related transcriptional regulator [Serratia rubidaea]WBF44426.1 LuxR C-terminal-related transcriptional regulator [Serratia rubidaea]
MVTMLVVSDNYCLSEGVKHIVYCNGLRVRVSKFKEVIGERGDFSEKYTIVTIDGGFWARDSPYIIIKILRRIKSTSKIILISNASGLGFISGYISKKIHMHDVSLGVECYLSTLRSLVTTRGGIISTKEVDGEYGNDGLSGRLTRMELKVMTLLSLGHRSNEIAELLNRSEKTISAHKTNAFKKLDLKNKPINLIKVIDIIKAGNISKR